MKEPKIVTSVMEYVLRPPRRKNYNLHPTVKALFVAHADPVTRVRLVSQRDNQRIMLPAKSVVGYSASVSGTSQLVPDLESRARDLRHRRFHGRFSRDGR